MKKNHSFLKSNAGFTLVEMLVAMVILGILLTMVMQSYWGLIQIYQKAEIMRQLQRESHFTLTRVADKMRYHSLNYQAYNLGGACGVTLSKKLCLGPHVFIFDDVTGSLTMDGQPLFSSDVIEVRHLDFSFTPDRDPFVHLGTPSAQTQPKLTLLMEVAAQDLPDLKFDLQATISSRKYTP